MSRYRQMSIISAMLLGIIITNVIASRTAG